MRGTGSEAYGTHRSVMSSGYIRIWQPNHPLAMKDGYVLEHRKVVFDAGIEIPQGYLVHHKNEKVDDNRLENLAVVHASKHWGQHGYSEVHNQFGVWKLDDPERVERNKATQKRNREQRIDAAKKDPSIVPHGTVGGATNYGCPCVFCKEAKNKYKRDRRKSKATNG